MSTSPMAVSGPAGVARPAQKMGLRVMVGPSPSSTGSPHAGPSVGWKTLPSGSPVGTIPAADPPVSPVSPPPGGDPYPPVVGDDPPRGGPRGDPPGDPHRGGYLVVSGGCPLEVVPPRGGSHPSGVGSPQVVPHGGGPLGGTPHSGKNPSGGAPPRGGGSTSRGRTTPLGGPPSGGPRRSNSRARPSRLTLGPS